MPEHELKRELALLSYANEDLDRARKVYDFEKKRSGCLVYTDLIIIVSTTAITQLVRVS